VVNGKYQYGIVIKELRLAKNIKQVELAKKLGKSKVWLCDLEHGRIGLKASMVKPLSNALGVQPDIFLVIG
jgi:transcriptional regulator with XRE-family HTH domain